MPASSRDSPACAQQVIREQHSSHVWLRQALKPSRAGIDRPVDWLKATGPVERPKSVVGGAPVHAVQQRASSAPLDPPVPMLGSPQAAPLANGMPLLPAGKQLSHRVLNHLRYLQNH